MATSPTPAFREEPPELVARRSDDGFGVEVTLFEANRAPDDRTTRWITAAETDCVSIADWR